MNDALATRAEGASDNRNTVGPLRAELKLGPYRVALRCLPAGRRGSRQRIDVLTAVAPTRAEGASDNDNTVGPLRAELKLGPYRVALRCLPTVGSAR